MEATKHSRAYMNQQNSGFKKATCCQLVKLEDDILAEIPHNLAGTESHPNAGLPNYDPIMLFY
ncbi:hypothetical protein COOONC_00998 [Cooperia oncophora]